MVKKFDLLGYELFFSFKRKRKLSKVQPEFKNKDNIRLNLGPGPNWSKPDASWYSVDVDPGLGDIVVDFQNFESLPLENNSVECVYGSHVFEHMSIFKSQLVFNEIYRVLKKGGILRIILPDAEKSIKEYFERNYDFELFKRRKARANKLYNRDYTIFECMKEDFLSPSSQAELLGYNSLAHQNAWDFEALKSDLIIAGFEAGQISKSDFRTSQVSLFDFEGTYPSEANEDYRSLYVEAIK